MMLMRKVGLDIVNGNVRHAIRSEYEEPRKKKRENLVKLTKIARSESLFMRKTLLSVDCLALMTQSSVHKKSHFFSFFSCKALLNNCLFCGVRWSLTKTALPRALLNPMSLVLRRAFRALTMNSVFKARERNRTSKCFVSEADGTR